MLRRLILRLGIIKASVVTTIVAVLCSVVISIGINHLWYGENSNQVIFFAIAAPVIIAPIFNYLFLRMVFQLEYLQAQLREIAIRDGLTGAFNRRHWIELAECELARARRYAGVFSVIMFDVDNFKHINDTYGHVAGDLVLCQLSSICMSQSRRIDAFARYGGEEFVFLLPQSDKAQAWLFAERIRTSLAQARFDFNQIEFGVTVSVGVITFCSCISNLDDLLIRVDKALYVAKKAGKDRTIVAQGFCDSTNSINAKVLTTNQI
ncbi:MAG: diguanylate cyclase [Chloroflexi bacterium]|nr:diguanylate cyclase [Chloroflexota bacterium]